MARQRSAGTTDGTRAIAALSAALSRVRDAASSGTDTKARPSARFDAAFAPQRKLNERPRGIAFRFEGGESRCGWELKGNPTLC